MFKRLFKKFNIWKQWIKKPLFFHRREFIVTTISILIFVVALIFSSKLILLFNAFSLKKEGARIETSVRKEQSNISKQREEIINSKVFVNPIERNDIMNILTIAQSESQKRNVAIVISDKDGFVFSRSHMPGQKGDNILQTTIQGIEISKGNVVNAIVRGSRSPLSLISGSLISEDNQTIGSIIIGHVLDDKYATSLKKEYLKEGEEIIFYTPQEGIVGDSLGDKGKTQLINTYFSLGSDIVSQNLDRISKEIKIGNNYYIIRNVVFPGLGDSPGGMFILFPINHYLYSIFLAVIITIFFFILYYITIYLLKFLYHHRHRLLFVSFVGLILFVIVYIITLTKLDYSAIELKKTPYLIYNSTIKFEPESDIVNTSTEKTVAINVSTGGEAINTVTAVVKYDPKAVDIVDILTTNSFCDPSFFIEKEIIPEKGEVRITCGSPNPGFSGATGTVAELLMQPLGPTPISLEFTKETQVLANDGLGTNVLRMSTNGYYQVIPKGSDILNIKSTIPIFSLSHPNSNRWYNKKDIKLSWPLLSGATYYYNLNQNPISNDKDHILSTTDNTVNISVEKDGIYYFHLQAKDTMGKSGPISTFKIMIDNTKPLTPNIRASSENIKKDEILRLDFTSEDLLSGLQSGFYVNINNNIFLPVKPPFYIPFLDVGKYPIVVRVFDKANNFSDSKIIINVTN